MDEIDLLILSILQEDASATIASIAAKVGLSATPCWKRVQKLETTGVLQKRVAIVSQQKVGMGLSAHIAIQAGDHSSASIDGFMRAVSAMPEVLMFCRMAGETDFMLNVVAPDMEAYDAFYKRLTQIVPLRSVKTYFVLQKIKSTTSLPLDFAPIRRSSPPKAQQD
jgi:Lrp/AsnC family transcriptional regulator